MSVNNVDAGDDAYFRQSINVSKCIRIQNVEAHQSEIQSFVA
jgi:hypothetical protein